MSYILQTYSIVGGEKLGVKKNGLLKNFAMDDITGRATG